MEVGLVALWLVTCLSLAFVALPVAALLFPRFADRGAGVAVPLSLALLAVPAYWVGHLAFGYPALLAGLAVLAGTSAVALLLGYRPRWRMARAPAVVFALAFLGMVAVRAVDPAAWAGGGEKFLDMGLLSSLARATVLPPEDMWFAGEPVRYYYGGHMLAALLVELTGTPPEYAYNLALAGYYAALVTAAFGLARAVAAERGVAPNVAGALAGFLVGVASNAGPPLRALALLLPDGAAVAERLGVARGRFGSKTIAHGLGEFSYWDASGGYVGGITEFPLFAWLNGDLHAHMMSQPFVLLLAALLYSYYRTPEASVWRRRALVFGCVPLLGGFLAVVNTWDVPTVVGLSFLAVTFAPARPSTLFPAAVRRAVSRARRRSRDVVSPRGGAIDRAVVGLRRELRRNLLAGAIAAGVAGLVVLAALPFFLGAVGGSGRGLGLLPERSGLAGLIVVHGAFLLVTAVYLLGAVGRDWGLLHWAGLVAVVAVLLVATFPYRLTAVPLLVPLLLAGWWLLRRGDAGYETVLVVGALGLVLLVEFAFLQEKAGPGRMNTVFKYYAHVWLLWSTASGVMLASVADAPRAVADLRAVLRRGAARLGRSTAPVARVAPVDRVERDGRLLRRRNLGALFAVLLVVSLSIYGGIALYAHAEGATDEPTLDATRYVFEHHPGEASAIEWIDQRPGQPTIVSAPGTAIYQWVNAPSSLTGVPTVAGWIHETGYRDPEAYYARVADVERIFTGDAVTRASLLREYDVAYIYVGPLERERYDLADLGDDPGIRPRFQTGAVTIYAVDQSALVGAGNGTASAAG